MIKTRVTELLGIEYPIVQAPMGWIARAQLASAVSNAGGLGIIETSSGELDAVREEVKKMRRLTTKPFGVNIAQAFVRDPDIVSFVVDQGVKFVTTSAGDPNRYCSALQLAARLLHQLHKPTNAGPLQLPSGVVWLCLLRRLGPHDQREHRPGPVRPLNNVPRRQASHRFGILIFYNMAGR